MCAYIFTNVRKCEECSLPVCNASDCNCHLCSKHKCLTNGCNNACILEFGFATSMGIPSRQYCFACEHMALNNRNNYSNNYSNNVVYQQQIPQQTQMNHASFIEQVSYPSVSIQMQHTVLPVNGFIIRRQIVIGNPWFN